MTPMNDIVWTQMVDEHLTFELDHSVYWTFLASAPQPWPPLAHWLLKSLMQSIGRRLYRAPDVGGGG